METQNPYHPDSLGGRTDNFIRPPLLWKPSPASAQNLPPPFVHEMEGGIKILSIFHFSAATPKDKEPVKTLSLTSFKNKYKESFVSLLYIEMFFFDQVFFELPLF